MADALRRAIGGSSDPFYATALMLAGRCLAAAPVAADRATAFRDSVAAIGELGGAKPSDRTMLDALAPAAEVLTRSTQAGGGLAAAVQAAAKAAEAGMAATEAMLPRLGRASYSGARAVGDAEAGPAAVAVWLRALAG